MSRITFGIIALNSQPFLLYNLRALYPFAHEIIIVEGAVKAAKSLADERGHSTDGTLEMLRKFVADEDPLKKLQVIIAENSGYPEGYWPEKDEMSRAYARLASGDWLWQVDSDEFYFDEDLAAVSSMLDRDPTIDTVSFPYTEFFGSFHSTISGAWHLKEYPLVHRLFKWREGYKYQTHRPATVLDEEGVDLRVKNWIRSPFNHRRPIGMLHYSYVFPKQAMQKVGYYSNVEWTEAFRQNSAWFEESYSLLKRPMFLGERGWPTLQWLERYDGRHPQQIRKLQADIASGQIEQEVRQATDIEALLASPIYSIQRVLGRAFLTIYWPIRTVWKSLRRSVLALIRVRFS